MAKARFLLQAVTEEDHSSVIREALGKDLDELLISVAFAKSQGAVVIKAALEKNKGKCSVFVGIRNDITSYQALEAILETGAKLYAVDTGSRTTIFHPKIYLAKFKKSATAIIGSANLTFGGLHNNIEASSILDLDLSLAEDKDFVDQAEIIFNGLVATHPNHVIHIKNKSEIKEIFESGRVVDETVVVKQKSSRASKGRGDTTPLMKLFKKVPLPVTKKKAEKGFIDEIVVNEDGREEVTYRPSIGKPNTQDYYLVWQSKELKERDLNIPTGGNTNPTGSMLWKKGAMVGIDQRHYFREEVFIDVGWVVDASLAHYERAKITTHIFTKGEYKGTFELKISHNTRTTSRSYQQKNAMTNVSWGDAKIFIAQNDLLGRIMTLHRKDSTPPEFMIEID
ncbi:phospholipase D-like domain-containing protein [Achromobacter sp. ACM05]|uniref:phospholipase D-like domain-containing protein n=1 Tax=Achromobacter sp. ACM05 TaxID=2854776 RepID=UPI001C458EB5|nr:phospholipase D family protein [Achromobacter sp. ACM05]MBV7502728.1 phospholipase D family protein [Achromobacter sp. ACM05]